MGAGLWMARNAGSRWEIAHPKCEEDWNRNKEFAKARGYDEETKELRK
ncbi:MAG TPA: hypothetical protein VGT03_09445 [Candidatus Acidoferrales bacterium]|nr:hypothetical protein [Candidatus Acidoferrales bacterium]